MNGSLAIDVLVVLLVVAAAVGGWRSGLFRSVVGALGLIAGGIAAYLLLPQVSAWVPAPEWRVAAIIAAGVALLALGTAVGALLGRLLQRGARAVKLSMIDRGAGLLVSGVAAALALSTVAGGLSALGAPVLSQAVGGSLTLGAIDRVTPDPVKSFLASVRNTAVGDALPWLIDTLAPPATLPPAADVDASSPALEKAAASVVRVSGVAYRCGTGLTGSGFVVADDRVVTNAHVVAGVEQPVVETPGESPHQASVVYFDAATDLAVLQVPGLDAAPLRLGAPLDPGAGAAVQGYPFGGPFVSGAATVAEVTNIARADGSGSRQVYTLSAEVNKGNSGGPLLETDGSVAGVVFAKSAVADHIGYALTDKELAPVVSAAPGLSASVSSGQCAA
ncbi:MarP family serine protease [Rathayibacter sp. YIM 133350]|uniref:MarP family serine protease n=1 Tax=Rathayibacter sp. YIM 133350 TaxID=3131992 RepID=UPI00307CEAFC